MGRSDASYRRIPNTMWMESTPCSEDNLILPLSVAWVTLKGRRIEDGRWGNSNCSGDTSTCCLSCVSKAHVTGRRKSPVANTYTLTSPLVLFLHSQDPSLVEKTADVPSWGTFYKMPHSTHCFTVLSGWWKIKHSEKLLRLDWELTTKDSVIWILVGILKQKGKLVENLAKSVCSLQFS